MILLNGEQKENLSYVSFYRFSILLIYQFYIIQKRNNKYI